MSLLEDILHAPIAWLNSVPVVVGLLLNYAELRQSRKAEQVRNQLAMVENHRDIWTLPFTHPELKRVLEHNPNLSKKPITNEESLFVTFLILHLKAVLLSEKEDMFVRAKHLDRDIRWIFSLPIPKEVWQRSKSFQDPELIALIDEALNFDSVGVSAG